MLDDRLHLLPGARAPTASSTSSPTRSRCPTVPRTPTAPKAWLKTVGSRRGPGGVQQGEGLDPGPHRRRARRLPDVPAVGDRVVRPATTIVSVAGARRRGPGRWPNAITAAVAKFGSSEDVAELPGGARRRRREARLPADAPGGAPCRLGFGPAHHRPGGGRRDPRRPPPLADPRGGTSCTEDRASWGPPLLLISPTVAPARRLRLRTDRPSTSTPR